MNENKEWNEFVQTEKSPIPEPVPVKKAGIPKVAWLVGCGCAALLAIAVIAAIVIYAIYSSLSNDPITSRVPSSSPVYMTVDFQQAQSGNLERIASVFQKVAGVNQSKTMMELLDESLKQVDMTFKDDLLPWMGTHGSVAITNLTYGNYGPTDAELMVIVEARNTTGADAFIKKLVKAMTDKQGLEFKENTKNGVTLYVGQSGSQPLVIGRSGNFVYFANSETAVNDSIGMASKDSLASSNAYKTTLAALPSGRLATFYVSGEAYGEYVKTMVKQSGLSGSLAGSDLGGKGLVGVAMSVSAEDVGLKIDAAVAYDQSKLSDFEKKSITATYQAPTVDKFVPDDTFFFMAVNSSQKLGASLSTDNPAYTSDVQESLKLLEQTWGFSLKEVLDLFGGEIGFAIGPAKDGLLPDEQNIKLGFSVLASTADEKGFETWVGNHLDSFTSQMGIKVTPNEVKFGKYTMQELSTENPGKGGTMPILYYGGAQGHAIIASSKDSLNKILVNNESLATNANYIKTWKAFPSGSKPVLYVYMPGIIDLTNDPGFAGGSSALQASWKQIPVIAMAMTKSPASTISYSMIIFIDTTK